MIDSEGWRRSFLSRDKDKIEAPLVTEGVGPESLSEEPLDPVPHNRAADFTARGDAEADRPASVRAHIDDQRVMMDALTSALSRKKLTPFTESETAREALTARAALDTRCLWRLHLVTARAVLTPGRGPAHGSDYFL